MRTELIAKILETAGHENTSDAEALAAVRQARAMLLRGGKTFPDIIGGSVTVVKTVMPTGTNVPYAKWVEKVATLEAEVEELKRTPRGSKAVDAAVAAKLRPLEAEVSRLETALRRAEQAGEKSQERINALTSQNKQLNSDVNRLTRRLRETMARAGEQATIAEIRPSIDVSGEVSYGDWADAVALKLGSAQGWQMTIEEQTAKLGKEKAISRRDIQRWRKRGNVPDIAVSILKEIEVSEADEPPIIWNATKVAQVRALVEQRKSEMDIAKRLSDRWGQRVTDNNIKRLKHDSRTKQRLWQERGWGPPMGQPRVPTTGTLHASPASQSAASRLRFTTPTNNVGHG